MRSRLLKKQPLQLRPILILHRSNHKLLPTQRQRSLQFFQITREGYGTSALISELHIPNVLSETLLPRKPFLVPLMGSDYLLPTVVFCGGGFVRILSDETLEEASQKVLHLKMAL